MIPSGCGENARTNRDVDAFRCLDARTNRNFFPYLFYTDLYLTKCPNLSPSVLKFLHYILIGFRSSLSKTRQE